MLSNSGYREAKQPPNLWHIDGDTLFSIWDGAFLKMPRPKSLHQKVHHILMNNPFPRKIHPVHRYHIFWIIIRNTIIRPEFTLNHRLVIKIVRHLVILLLFPFHSHKVNLALWKLPHKHIIPPQTMPPFPAYSRCYGYVRARYL